MRHSCLLTLALAGLGCLATSMAGHAIKTWPWMDHRPSGSSLITSEHASESPRYDDLAFDEFSEDSVTRKQKKGPKDVPWLEGIWVASISLGGKHACTGTIYTALMILTLPDCIDSLQSAELDNIVVEMGYVERGENPYGFWPVDRAVVAIDKGPPGCDQRDCIGVLKLDWPVPFTIWVGGLEAPPPGSELAGSKAQIFGWEVPNPEKLAFRLQQIDVTISKSCPGRNNQTEHTVCATSEDGIPPFSGGGPLVVELDKRKWMVGIYSGTGEGAVCYSIGTSAFKKWLDSAIA